MDFLRSEPGHDPVTISGVFPVSPERLFRAWTEADELKKWFGPRPNSLLAVDLDLRVGGAWSFLLGDSPEKRQRLMGEYLEIERNSMLVFSWSHVEEFSDGGREATAFSRVTVRFTEVQRGTRLDLRHENIQSEDGRKGVGHGWLACANNLMGHCEAAPPES